MATSAPISRPWPWWSAPAAVLLALALTLLASVLLAGILAAAGVKGALQGNNGAVNVGLTALQDIGFVVGPLVLATLLTGTVSPDRPRLEPFGLVRVPLGRALKWAAAAVAVYFAFALVFSAVAGGHEQKDLFDELGVHRGSATVLVVAFVVCVMAPIAEEFLFRGFCYTALRSRLGVVGAALAVGVVFGAVHFTSTPAVLLVQLGVLGAVLCLVRERTGSLVPCIGLHSMNNAISFGVLVGWGWGTVGLLGGALGACALVLAPLTATRPAR